MRKKRKFRWIKWKGEKRIIMIELEQREKFMNGREGEKRGRYMGRKNKEEMMVNK